MEGDPLQPCDGAGTIYHVGVSADYWRDLLKEDENLDDLGNVYNLCLIKFCDAVSELAKLRREGIHLGVNLFSLIQRLLENVMLIPFVHPLPMQNTRYEEMILLSVKSIRIVIHQKKKTTAGCLDAHRLAVKDLYLCGDSLGADQKREAVGEMLREAKMLFHQIDAECKECLIRLRLTIERIVECRVQNNKIRDINASLYCIVSDLQHRGRTAAPTQEGGVESQPRLQNCTTIICNNWRQGGACSYGERCRFVHGQQELRHRSPPHPTYNTKPCVYFLTPSGCKKGDNCGYLHVSPPE